MPTMPMFPLGSVLFPRMPLPLRIFEPRYREMLRVILPDEPSEFGVVLIERGFEVGGGDARMGVGTVAQIVQLAMTEDSVLLVAMGDRRIEVTEWLPDDPFPKAEVRVLPELEWSDDLQPLRDSTELLVRQALARASEWGEVQWSPDVELGDDDPMEAVWQLAGIAPLGPLDQASLLRATSAKQLLERVTELVRDVDSLHP